MIDCTRRPGARNGLPTSDQPAHRCGSGEVRQGASSSARIPLSPKSARGGRRDRPRSLATKQRALENTTCLARGPDRGVIAASHKAHVTSSYRERISVPPGSPAVDSRPWFPLVVQRFGSGPSMMSSSVRSQRLSSTVGPNVSRAGLDRRCRQWRLAITFRRATLDRVADLAGVRPWNLPWCP